jgi:phage terminase small subunit
MPQTEPAGSGDAPDPNVNPSEALQTGDPVAFLRALMMDPTVDMKLRQDSAKRLIAYEKKKPGERGKKDDQADAAVVAAGGKFAPMKAPKLHAVK